MWSSGPGAIELRTVFVDSALMREGEPSVRDIMGIPVEVIDARADFLGIWRA